VRPGGPLLAIDTATTRAVIALGRPDGTLISMRSWVAGYRHGEELLARIEELLRDAGVAPADLGGLVVGTGPGAFTGLRVGIATAKGLAHSLALPIVGLVTGHALLAADMLLASAGGETRAAAGGEAGTAAGGEAGTVALLQPAGPSDRVLTRPGEHPVILPGGTDPDLGPGERLVAVDLAGRAPDDAAAAGDAALDGLAAALLRTGAARLAAGDADDLATLVPEYVTLPRGIREAPPDGGVELTGGTA
jgi:tRNA threonylcarbamoyladenosine biosynthesis protein TsaB